MECIEPYVAPTALRALGAVGAVGAGYKMLDLKTGLGYDLLIARRFLPVLSELKYLAAKEYTITDVWQDAVARYGDKTAITFENRRMSFLDMERTAVQMAHWLRSKGIGRDDCVSLYMENKPEFVCWWLAITRLGAKVGLLNYNIKSKGLVHCVKVSFAKAIVCDEDTEQRVSEVANNGLEDVMIFFWNSHHPRFLSKDTIGSLPAKAESETQPQGNGRSSSSQPTSRLHCVTYDDLLDIPAIAIDPACRKGIKFNDFFGYIYTSGTTGLPKAANIMHMKLWSMGAFFVAFGQITEQDILYTCLPIFHSAGGGIGVCCMMRSGASLVLSRKFSSHRFWEEVSVNRCTVIQYIGELGRYMVNHAKKNPSVYEIPHCVRLAVGNGMRPEVWDDFQDGFQINEVMEFYGSTEGNGALVNLCHISNDKGARGAVGRLGLLAGMIMGVKIVKFDIVEEKPIRGKDGLCVECGANEKGELLMPIKEGKPHTTFVGYTDKKSSEKKIIENVFVKGDKYFRTGDLLSRDERGRYFFGDRIGDTFRWKGENVSTTEVSEVVSSFKGLTEANIYGVEVPGSKDGRACLAALSFENNQTLNTFESSPDVRSALLTQCKKELPNYALPLFLRLLKSDGPSTETMKQQKVVLRDQGCDPSKCSPDPLFYLNPASGGYDLLTPEIFATFESGGGLVGSGKAKSKL